MTRLILYLFIIIIFLNGEKASGHSKSDSVFQISGIYITGNKVSKKAIIIKELTFKEGDTLSKKEIIDATARSRENLLNTSLFNFVNISYASANNSEMLIYISVIERWYIWPVPIFEHAERNFGAFIHDPNWNRINYGGQIFWYNFRGRKEQVKLRLRFGYKEQFEILYEKPNFGSKQQHGLTFSINQNRQHEVNIDTKENKAVYLRKDDRYLLDFFNPYLTYSYRSSLYSRNFLTLSYFDIAYRDSATHEDFTGLVPGLNSRFFFLEYKFENDFRDSKAYPLKGYYIRIGLKRRQLLTESNREYTKSFFQLTTSYNGMLAGRLYHNNALNLQLSRENYEPKIYRYGLGYRTYLRGYELFVMDGNSYSQVVNNLKYCLLKERSYNLAYIPWSQFNPVHLSIYSNLFFDMAYVKGKYYSSDGNDYVNRLLYTMGLGLDVVSYYDQVIRFEVSVNREGQAGFFIHTEVPFSRW